MVTQRESRPAAVACRRIVMFTAAVLAIAIAAPAMASAMGKTVFVSTAPVKGPFNSCSTPGYNSIQEAINVDPAGTAVHVCAGTYEEQVVLQKADSFAADSGATLKLPGSPTNSQSPCDNEPENEQDLFMVCTAGKVNISGLTLDGAWPSGTCNDDLYALNAGAGVKLTLTGVKILHAGAVPINGCQGGIGIQIGRKFTGQSATATLTGDVVEGYQKNGIDVDGPGSSAKISAVTVTGAGPTPEIAQNGMQIARGAKAKISGSTVTGNECEVAGACGPNALAETQSAGVLIFGNASGVKVSSDNVSNNDIGVYYAAGFESPAPSEATVATIAANTLKENRYEGMVLEEGSPKINGNQIIGGGTANVGIQLLQFGANTLGLKATGTGDAITGMKKCAVEGLSDNEPSDKQETLNLKNSLGKFSGNAQPLCNNNEGKIHISIS
jgi:Right handed beta helix region